jgi:hypothetical protein
MTGIFEIVQEQTDIEQRRERREKSLDDYRRWKQSALRVVESQTFLSGPRKDCLRDHHFTSWFFRADDTGVVQSYLDETPLLTQICNLITGESYDE